MARRTTTAVMVADRITTSGGSGGRGGGGGGGGDALRLLLCVLSLQLWCGREVLLCLPPRPTCAPSDCSIETSRMNCCCLALSSVVCSFRLRCASCLRGCSATPSLLTLRMNEWARACGRFAGAPQSHFSETKPSNGWFAARTPSRFTARRGQPRSHRAAITRVLCHARYFAVLSGRIHLLLSISTQRL